MRVSAISERMPQVSLDLPTHLIDVPAGRSSERYYIPIYNVSNISMYFVQNVPRRRGPNGLHLTRSLSVVHKSS
jgi:hypothetical protein